MTIDPAIIRDIVNRALQEDLQGGQDVTTFSTIAETITTSAVMRTRKPGILAGLDCALAAFRAVDNALNLTPHKKDGDALTSGDDLLTITGSARAILTAERTALNFITHLSGIATLTNQYVEAIKETKAQIFDTRKTIPGLRHLQKHAVKMGGGHNHRMGLHDMVMIKDNHIALSGEDIKTIIPKARNAYDGTIEIEVDTLEQLAQILPHKPDIILLDNMAPGMLREAVNIVDGQTITEASGGITLETVRAIAASGVDRISVGALTHSAPSLDIGLDITLDKAKP